MAKRKTFEQIIRGPHETKQFTVKNRGLEYRSSNTIYFDCPFCGVEMKAYLWSLNGSGKRCGCGAFHLGSGVSHKAKEV